MAAGFKTATVNASDVPATQIDFPVYVDLSRLGITTQAEANSVRVYADSGKSTEWAREIVSVTEMWVKVPSLTSTVAMYVDWDGSSADYSVSDTYGRNAVWSDYLVVYHMSGTTDSTGSGETLVATGSPTLITGAFGGSNAAYDYPGNTSNYHKSTNNIIPYTDTNDWTIQAWAIPDITTRGDYFGAYGELLLKYGRVSTKFEIISTYAGSSAVATASTTNAADSWWLTHGTLVYSSRTAEIFVNGVSKASHSGSGSRPTYDGQLSIGVEWAAAPYNAYDGGVDEARIRQGVLTSNWMLTEYNNQSDEAGFWGTWSDVGGSTFTPRVSAVI